MSMDLSLYVSGMPNVLSCLASVQLMSMDEWDVWDADCTSKCTHKKQFRYQCTAMSSLPSIIVSLLHIIKLMQTALYG